MIALENITSQRGDEISFTNLNTSFEIGFIHGIWNETDNVNTAFLKLLTGNAPLGQGTIRYKGVSLDHADVAYYNKADMPGSGFENELVPYQYDNKYEYNNKLVYLFDNIFGSADMRSLVHLYKMVLSLKKMGRTILITSTDHRALLASTDFFHILSKGAFQAKIHFRQYDLLDGVIMQMQHPQP